MYYKILGVEKDAKQDVIKRFYRKLALHRSTLIRADKAWRLKRDLAVNFAGTALALELLDEIDALRQNRCSFKFRSRVGRISVFCVNRQIAN